MYPHAATPLFIWSRLHLNTTRRTRVSHDIDQLSLGELDKEKCRHAGKASTRDEGDFFKGPLRKWHKCLAADQVVRLLLHSNIGWDLSSSFRHKKKGERKR